MSLSLSPFDPPPTFTLLLLMMVQMIIAGVWITSALYSIPKFLFVHTVNNDLGNGKTESICIINRQMYDSKLFDFINFGILYIIPLLVISVSVGVGVRAFEICGSMADIRIIILHFPPTHWPTPPSLHLFIYSQILYSRIALALWRSSCGLERHIALQSTTMLANGGGGYSQNTFSTGSNQSSTNPQCNLQTNNGAGGHHYHFYKRQPSKLERRKKVGAEGQVQCFDC